MDEWPERSIGEIAQVVGGSTPPTSDPANFDGDIPWLTPKDLSGPHDRFVQRGSRNITDEGLSRCSAKLLPEGAVLLSTRAPIGYVAIAKNPVATNQGFRSLVVGDQASPDFVYYWLRANRDELERFATGSTFRELTGGALKRIRLRLPPLAEQHSIARVLGSLDDKIELNRRMSETLDQVARRLFRRVIESGTERTLADAAMLNPESWSKTTRPPIIEYVDLSNAKWGRILSTRAYAREDAPSRAQRVLRPGDTIVGTVRPSNGSFAFVTRDGLTGSTGFAVLRPRDSVPAEFVYLAATAPGRIEELGHLADGGAYPAVRAEVVLSTPTRIPERRELENFSRVVRPLFQRIAVAESESRALASIRDALLPKLVSGELRIPTAA